MQPIKGHVSIFEPDDASSGPRRSYRAAVAGD
jgi:hypothetical protein